MCMSTLMHALHSCVQGRERETRYSYRYLYCQPRKYAESIEVLIINHFRKLFSDLANSSKASLSFPAATFDIMSLNTQVYFVSVKGCKGKVICNLV